jgi:hypothetical protein
MVTNPFLYEAQAERLVAGFSSFSSLPEMIVLYVVIQHVLVLIQLPACGFTPKAHGRLRIMIGSKTR